MKILVILSMLIFFGFVITGAANFGLLHSYSAYSRKWKFSPPSDETPWTLVTIVAALLLLPPMIEAGEGNMLQFLGFFSPLYLIVVAFTPDWETKKAQHSLHVFGAITCAVLSLLWMVVICNTVNVILITALFFIFFAAAVDRFDAYVFWGEMILFLSTYITLLNLL